MKDYKDLWEMPVVEAPRRAVKRYPTPPVAQTVAPPVVDWTLQLTDAQRAALQNARNYKKNLAADQEGDKNLLLVAKLAEILDAK
jgi:hypothetical protein